jgi:hypothetical protein
MGNHIQFIFYHIPNAVPLYRLGAAVLTGFRV